MNILQRLKYSTKEFLENKNLIPFKVVKLNTNTIIQHYRNGNRKVL